MSQWLALGGTCACLRRAEGIVATQKVTRDALYGTAACANTAFSHYECPPPSVSYKDLMKVPYHTFTYISLARTFSFSFGSVAQLCLTLCDPMDYSTPGLPVHHQLPEFTQTHVH